MTINDLITKYDIVPAENNGRRVIRIYNQAKCDRDGAFDEIKARKAEILAWFDQKAAAEKAAAEARQRKINAIPGLAEIKAAIVDLAAWHAELNASFDDCGGLGVRSKPEYDMDALNALYPRAAAYIKAESWSTASNHAKAGAGQKALDRIINGEPEATVIADMEREWDAHVTGQIWD